MNKIILFALITVIILTSVTAVNQDAVTLSFPASVTYYNQDAVTINFGEQAVGDSCDTVTWDCTQNCLVDTGLNADGNTITGTGSGVIQITSSITNCNTNLAFVMSNGCNFVVSNGAKFC